MNNFVNPEDLLSDEQGDTGKERLVYALSGLKPEVVAVAFAKCSRSPKPFDEIAKEVDETSSAEFHSKWVVGYGHASVAEHAVLHVAFENISNIAAKVIEDNRLASYTEKSTRYQVIDKNRYYRPKNVVESDLGPLYLNTMNRLFETYHAFMEPLTKLMRAKFPKTETQSEKLYSSIIKARVCDVARYLLPAATYTNLGMTVNARGLEWAITKAMSHPLEELQAIGRELKEAGSRVTPTLIKYADRNVYLAETRGAFQSFTDAWAKDLPEPDPMPPVTIVDYDHDAENKLIASLLYRHSRHPYNQLVERARLMPREKKEAILNEALMRRGPHDQTLREFEHVYYTFDILMDYGAFRDVQRHRMATQTNQNVTVRHGYDAPRELAEAGLAEKFAEAMEAAKTAHVAVHARFPEEAQYLVPMAYRKRILITWNLRELHHFISLRSGKKGHPSYRRIAQLCYHALAEIQPLLAKYIRVDLSEEHVSTVGTKVKSEAALE